MMFRPVLACTLDGKEKLRFFSLISSFKLCCSAVGYRSVFGRRRALATPPAPGVKVAFINFLKISFTL